MNLVVMQPYLFPYIGYFQLIDIADLFLIYDDVSYIKRGYINRNNILSAGRTVRFTVPVPGASQNKLIAELGFSKDVAKVLKVIEHSYSKAPYFSVVFPMVREILENEDRSIASVCQKSYQTIFSYLDLNKKFMKTSELDYDRAASAKNRLMALCHKFGAECYINAQGGRALYKKSDFAEQGVELKFIESMPFKYSQSGSEFFPNLSIIDVLMNNSKRQCRAFLRMYRLTNG